MLATRLNDSFPPPHLFFNPDLLFDFHCLTSRPYCFIFTASTIARTLLLLPLCSFIVYHGLQLWRKHSRTHSAGAVSHTDCFTYHLAIMELISILGYIVSCFGIYMRDLNTLAVGLLLAIFTWYGEMFCHILTCVERYLAVVHPITYLSLKSERWVRIRNVSTGCVWLLCFVWMSLIIKLTVFGLEFGLFMLSLAIVSFCSCSALCALIRQSPGEPGRVRRKINKSKRIALCTIVSILAVLVMRLIWDLVWMVKTLSGESDNCLINALGIWFNLPCSLVLPFLFLHRTGKVVCKRVRRAASSSAKS